MSNKVLITGPSGSGKTFLTCYFTSHGLKALDADKIAELAFWYDSNGCKVALPQNAGKAFLDNHQFLWDKAMLRELLEDTSEIYLFGLSGNVFDFVQFFDRCYFLDAPNSLLLTRLQHDSRENEFGKTADQQQAVIDFANEIKKKATRNNFIFVDATLPPDKIIALIK